MMRQKGLRQQVGECTRTQTNTQLLWTQMWTAIVTLLSREQLEILLLRYRRISSPKSIIMVSPIPDIHEIQRDYQADQFLLLASDGIFKSLSSEQVMRFILKRLQCTTDITGICRDLILTAYYSVRPDA